MVGLLLWLILAGGKGTGPCDITSLEHCSNDEVGKLCAEVTYGTSAYAHCYTHCASAYDECELQELCLGLVDDSGEMHKEWARCDPCYDDITDVDCDLARFCNLYGEEPMLDRVDEICQVNCQVNPLSARCTDREEFCTDPDNEVTCLAACQTNYQLPYDEYQELYGPSQVHPCQTTFCGELDPELADSCSYCSWDGNCDWAYFCSFPGNETACQNQCASGGFQACHGAGREWCAAWCEETGQECWAACVVGGACTTMTENTCKLQSIPNDRCYQLALNFRGVETMLAYMPTYPPMPTGSTLTESAWRSMQVLTATNIRLMATERVVSAAAGIHGYFAFKYARQLYNRPAYVIVAYDHPYMALYADGNDNSDQPASCYVRPLGFRYGQRGGSCVPAPTDSCTDVSTKYLFFVDNASPAAGNDTFVIMPALNGYNPNPLVLGTVLTVDATNGFIQFAIPTMFDPVTTLPTDAVVTVVTQSAILFPCIGGQRQTTDTLGNMVAFDQLLAGVEPMYTVMNIISSGAWDAAHIPSLNFGQGSNNVVKYLSSATTSGCRLAALNASQRFTEFPTIAQEQGAPGSTLWLTVLGPCINDGTTALGTFSAHNATASGTCMTTTDPGRVRYMAIVPFAFQRLFYGILMPATDDAWLTEPLIVGQQTAYPSPTAYAPTDTSSLVWATVPALWNSERSGDVAVFYGNDSKNKGLLMIVDQGTASTGCQSQSQCSFPSNFTIFPSGTAHFPQATLC